MKQPEESDGLATLLREERAEPDPEFAAQLDRWAASGFARADNPRPGRPGILDRARARLAATPPRRMIAPVGALATLAVVVGVAISQVETGSDQGGTPTVAPVQDDAALEAAPQAEEPTGGAAPPAAATLDEADGRTGVPPGTGANDFGSGAERKVARDAQLTLTAEPEEITEVADGVTEVANRYDAIIVSSSVRGGDEDSSALGADFELRVPAADLQPLLADLSELASVRTQTEGSEDVTARFVGAEERIEELEATRQAILDQLAEAGSQQELDALRGRLDIVNSQLSAARDELDGARERVQLVPVSVSVVSEEVAGDDGDWGVEEAIDDAGRILSAAAGVVVVAGAVLLPLTVVGVILALILRGQVRRSRERALDE